MSRFFFKEAGFSSFIKTSLVNIVNNYFRPPQVVSQTHFTSPMPIPRMRPEQTKEDIRADIIASLMEHDYETTRQQLEQEAILIGMLENKIKGWNEQTHHYVLSVQNRAQQGYEIRGIFWQSQQDKLRKVVAPEEYQECLEQLDWLKTKRKIFEEEYSFITTPAPSCEVS